MISLLEIAQSINEADDDKYVSIGFGRFKLKGKEDDDDADVFVKTDSGKYVKSADQKSDDDGGKKPEEPQGGKLGGSDFDRDGGDSEKVDGPSPEDDWDNEQVMTAKIGGEEVGDIIDNPNHPNYDKAMDYVMSFNPDDEKLVTGPGSDIDGPSPEDDWDNEQVMTAKINGEEVGDIINNPNHTNYDKAMDYVMSFNPDDEKLVTGPGSDDDEADAKDNKHDISSHPFYRYYDSGANKGDDIEISDANSGPIDMDDIMDMLKKDPKIVGKMGDDVYFDGEDLVSSKFDDDTIGSVNYNMTLGDLKKQIMAYEPEETEESIKVIDGKKYKAIKESGKTINVNLKEKYDRIFRSLK